MNIQTTRTLLHGHPRAVRRVAFCTILALGLGAAMASADALLAGPLRTWAERTMNAKLNGYTVHIGRARLHLWRLAFELDDLVLVQVSHPDPPVADFGALEFSMQWWELVHYRVTGDLTLRRPALHIDLAQIEEETGSHVTLKDRGWQGAVESIFPIRLNQVRVLDGSLLYLAQATASKPLQLTRVFMVARNVRNIDAARLAYPSPVSMEGLLFDTGKISFQGAADFLREPYLAAHGTLQLGQVPLDRFDPLAGAYQLKTQGGFLTAAGTLEFTPATRKAHLSEVLFENLRVDYVTSRATQGAEQQHAQEAVKLARSVRNAPGLLLRVDSLKVTHGQLGFVNEGTQPPYRVFISDGDLDVKNLSNQAGLGRSEFHARGDFMGHGDLQVSGGVRLTELPADFDLQLKLEKARLADLNALFNAYAGLEVAGGEASVFSEITVKGGRLEGYIKPILKNVKIYDRRKDQAKPLGKRIKLHLIQFLAGLFKNHSTQEVATITRLSGSISDPEASEWQTVRKLFGNGFFRAILPGFLDGSKPPVPDAARPRKQTPAAERP